jgi:signal transduction histidine kinase
MQWIVYGAHRHFPGMWRAGKAMGGLFLGLALLQALEPAFNPTPWVMHALLAGALLSGALGGMAASRQRGVLRGLALLMGLSSALTALNAVVLLGWWPVSALSEASFALSHLSLVVVAVAHLVVRAVESHRQRQQAEARAAQAEQRRESEQRLREEKSDLLAMIAHEVRTPLAVIDASMQSLAVLDADMPPERARRHERIGRALQRLGSLLDLVVQRDRLDVSQWSQDLEALAPQALAAALLADLGEDAQHRVSLHAEDDLPTVRGDARMLRLALSNLVGNALKYSPAGRPVGLFVRRLDWPGRPGVAWTVVDQGGGIHPDDHEKVFRKYYRAAEGSDAPGLGLGLYLVRQIAERHAGAVRVLPTVAGQGASLELWVPLHPPAAPLAPPEAAA